METLNKEITLQALKEGFRESFFAATAVGLFGIVFGVLAQTRGLSMLEINFMSAMMFAGSAQMIALGMWAQEHYHVFVMGLTAFIVCLRFFLMTAALQPSLREVPKWQIYPSLFFLIDENWALTMLKIQQKKDKRYIFTYLLTSGLSMYIAWVGGTLIGSLIGEQIADPTRFGFDFAFVAIFLALLVSMWRDKKDLCPWLSSALVAAITAQLIPGNWYIVLGAIAGSTVGVWREYH